MLTNNVVTVRGLQKCYGRRKVVDGVDLDVLEGEVVGLIGANGAGKTTTVECIQGLRRPDAGMLRVLGLDPARDAERLRPLIGSQLQDSALPDRLRVAEAVELFSPRRTGDGEALLERQRLFLVLALLGRPRLVILDELTQGLDPSVRRNVWAAVSQLRNEGTTVLLVTHELGDAEALCDRVVAMRAGRILDSGPPAELVDRHARRATIRFGLQDVAASDALLEELRDVAGVDLVERDGQRATVYGDRSAIAHVGAALVRNCSVPADLSVQIPTLEDALLDLLDGPEAPLPSDNHDQRLIGAMR
jgi:ABC-2 type transport system ATP-binding protein